MQNLDWIVVVASIAVMAGIGAWFTRRASRSVEDYFISGRSLPWWLIGLSSVATYTDAGLAPAVVMWVYSGGLLGNGVWWIPFAIWMPLSIVIWSKLWRNLRTVTTAEMLEVRYGGSLAASYRTVYALFLSLGFVVVLMGYVSGWLGSALGPIVGWTPLQLIVVLGIVTAIYTTLGGLYGVVYSDAAQFLLFLGSNILLVPLVLKAGGGWSGVYDKALAARGPEFFSISLPNAELPALTILAFVVQGLFFAAAPTGGEGFTAQRFMAARDEFHAQVGQFFNTALTIIVRVLPLLFLGVAAAALIPQGALKPEEAWATLVARYAPVGVVGLVVAGLLAAYMSTISTEMNWGASYLVNDVYRRAIRKDASSEHYVMVSRLASLLLFAASLVVAYFFVSGMKAWFLFINSVVFAFVLPLSWLRFFWWRLNIYGEASALVLGLPLGYLVWFPLGFSEQPFWRGFLLLFGLGFLVILITTFLTRPESEETLREFYTRCRPPGFWGPVIRALPDGAPRREAAETWNDVLDGALGILFCGGWIYITISIIGRHTTVAVVASVITALAMGLFIYRLARRGVFRSL